MAMKQKLNLNIDFSYLDNAIQYTYDFESTPELFTGAFITDKSFSLMFFGDEQFDDIQNEELIRQMRLFAEKPLSKKYLKIESADELNYHVYRYYINDKESNRRMLRDFANFISSRPLQLDENYAIEKGNKDFAEYRSWNGSRYDVNLAILIFIAANSKRENLTPYDIRQLSNAIIKFDDADYKLADYLEKETCYLITKKQFKFQRNIMLWGDGHIDWAKIAKDGTETEGTNEKLLPPGLKKEMARFGLDIIFDETVSNDDPRQWTEEERNTLVDYNFNDVLGTRIVGENDYLVGELKTRDIIRKSNPYTCARAVPITELKNEYKSPPERDATAANLAGLVLIGPNKIKPEDYLFVDYRFPLPDGNGGTVLKDLLQHIIDTEEFIHPYFIEFFSHFRGQDTRSSRDDYKVKLEQPITHQPTMNVPYYKDGKPINAYCRVSTGGAHGATHAGLSKMSPDEINSWIKSDEGVDPINKFTVDVKNVIHADWSSFYPVMASKMQMYKTSEGIDRYTNIINYRFEIKDKAHQLWLDGKKDTEEYVFYEESQMGLKFILNNATGAANTHRPGALLPLDNKTLSMRLIGNMFIWTLGQRLAQEGAYIISTNTDGLFFCNMTMEKAQEIMDKYIEDYGMDVEPEFMARFINRDTSNRVELPKDIHSIDKVGGVLRHAIGLDFNRRSLGQNITYPLIAGHAALEYMAGDDEWLQKPYDRSRVKSYIESILEKGNEYRNAWYHTHVGTASQRLTINGERQQRINRLVLTKNGDKFGSDGLRKLKKDDAMLLWNAYVTKSVDNLADVIFDENEITEYGLPLQSYDLSIDNINLMFGQKMTNGKEEYYEPCKKVTNVLFNDKGKFNGVVDDTLIFELDNPKRLAIQWKSLNNDNILLYQKPNGEWEPVKRWRKSDKLKGYQTSIGQVLNTYEELFNFDYSQIDVDAYVMWTEDLLKHWKKSADVPEIDMKLVDDTVVTVEKKVRKTKENVVLDVLRNYYGLEQLLQ